jgi:hypothetical protein
VQRPFGQETSPLPGTAGESDLPQKGETWPFARDDDESA